MAYQLSPIVQSSFRVTIEGVLDTYFTQVSGLSMTREVTQIGDGYSDRPNQILGRTETETLEMTKPYEPEIDGEKLLALFNSGCGTNSYTITVQPVKQCNGVEKRGEAITALGCKCVGIEFPEIDADSNDVATIMLSFAYSDIQTN